MLSTSIRGSSTDSGSKESSFHTQCSTSDASTNTEVTVSDMQFLEAENEHLGIKIDLF